LSLVEAKVSTGSLSLYKIKKDPWNYLTKFGIEIGKGNYSITFWFNK